MKFSYIILILFTLLSQKTTAQIDIQLRNTNSTLEVWLMPKASYTGTVSSLIFTISWDAAYAASLATCTSMLTDLPISLSGSGATMTNGSRKYNVYSIPGTGNPIIFTNNTPIKVMTVHLSSTINVLTGQFSIGNDAFTAANNFDFFIEIGTDVTGTTSSIATNVVLPLTLLNFNAIEQNNSAYLTWKTENETNFSHFQVERGENAVNHVSTWTTIDSIPKSDIKNPSKDLMHYVSTEGVYFLTDDKAFIQKPMAMYRLKMLNLDGSFTYSKVVSVEQKNGTKGSIKLYPNPTRNDVQLTIEATKDAQQTIEIVDIMGKLWQQTPILLQKGVNQQTLTVRALPSGVYFLTTLNSAGIKEMIRFVKL
jgi:hypothetical protein